jgi:phosphohistidine phosphatase
MNKRIILVRHSKAESRNHTQNDIDRPLNSDGEADSKKMADLLLRLNVKPDIILTSSARRAADTAKIFAGVLNIAENNITVTRRLYYSSSKIILDYIYGFPPTIGCAMVVAHNPGISEIAMILSSGRILYMENTQMAIIEYDAEHWDQLDIEKPVSFKSYKSSEWHSSKIQPYLL